MKPSGPKPVEIKLARGQSFPGNSPPGQQTVTPLCKGGARTIRVCALPSEPKIPGVA